MASSSSTVISCPGKVLLAGGYLVLDPAHQGFVISTPSRFYTVVQPASRAEDTEDSFGVTVISPQFTDGRWEYAASKVEGEWEVEAVKSASSNTFVHLSISSSLLLASALHPSGKHASLLITIVGSNDFYSQPRTDNTPPPPFAPLGCPISQVHKTGLGSSAAMVTSLTSALFLHFLALPPAPAPALAPSSTASPDKATLLLVHNLAQYVHSLAQGKVGSGFDVSAAVWGSQVYRRFAVECLGDLLASNESKKLTAKSLLSILSPLLNDRWTSPSTSARVSPFALPPGTTLILADVDAGSNTPSMVGKVLAWKKASPAEADALWGALKQSNSDLAETFATLTRLAKEDREAYVREVDPLALKTGDEFSSSKYPFSAAREHILTTRKYMREMGEASDVPIEPPSQTKLLDACSAIPGVIGAGVPGAGGYDAIWVLVLAPSTDSKPEEEVEKLLQGWTEMSVRPLSTNAWVHGGQEEVERGLVREVLEEVEGLQAAVDGSS